MRQVDDPVYHALLQKLRQGLVDSKDHIKLQQLFIRDNHGFDGKYIIRENKLRHTLNLLQTMNFAAGK